MKFTLTITDANSADLSRILAMIGGAMPETDAIGKLNMPAAVIQQQPAPTATNTSADDDESGDADAAPGTLDADGLPHDSRIHSMPAKLTSKGVWRKRRGVSDGEVSAVEAELRAKLAAGAPQQMQQPAPVQQMQPQQPAAPQSVDFNGFMQKIQMLLAQRDAAGNPLIDANYLASVSQRVGQAFGVSLNSITDLAPNQQWLDYAIQIMNGEGRWR